MRQWKCYICNNIHAIEGVCWHQDKDSREFAVKMKEIEILPTKPKDNGYQYKPVGG